MTDELVAYFWRHAIVRDGCWGWHRSFSHGGYASTRVGGPRRAHRVSWEINRGSIPLGMHVLHSCDNPPCTNPDHLWLGTNQDNVRDAIAKGRRAAQRGTDKPPRKLTPAAVHEIRALRADGVFIEELARRFAMSESAIGHLLHGRTWARV